MNNKILAIAAFGILSCASLSATTPEEFNNKINLVYSQIYLLDATQQALHGSRVITLNPGQRLISVTLYYGGRVDIEQNFLNPLYQQLQNSFNGLSEGDKARYRTTILPQAGKDFLEGLKKQWNAPVAGIEIIKDLINDLVTTFKAMGVTLTV